MNNTAILLGVFLQGGRHKSTVPPLPDDYNSPNCPICGKMIGLRSALNRHYITHTGARPFSCEICGKTFSQKGNLKTHMWTHRPDRRYSCATCGHQCITRSHLKRHMKNNHGESLQWLVSLLSKVMATIFLILGRVPHQLSLSFFPFADQTKTRKKSKTSRHVQFFPSLF